MKRFFAGLLAAMMCLAMTSSVFAAGFVESVTYKPAPEIVGTPDDDGRIVIGHVVDPEGNIITTEYEDCIVITPISEVDTSTEIPKDAADLLKKVYEDLLSGATDPSDVFPDAGDLVVKDLFDATTLCDELKTHLPVDGNTIDLTFDANIEAGMDVYVMVYVDGQWVPVKNVINNGDGTITCTFEDICPIAILVPESAEAPTTGDVNGSQIVIWSVLLGASLLAMVVAVVVYRRKIAE